MRLAIVITILRLLALITPTLTVPSAKRSDTKSRDLRAAAILVFASTRNAAMALGIVTLLCGGTLFSGSANAAWEYYAEGRLDLCNRGEIDVSAVVGETSTGWPRNDKPRARAFFPVERNDCTEISIMQDRNFNLGFVVSFENGELGYIVLDATKGTGSGKEITYKQRSDWFESALLKPGYLNSAAPDGNLAGYNFPGRTCVRADGEPTDAVLSSWNWDDACPDNHVPLHLSNWIRVAYDDRYIQVIIYPKRSQIQSLSGAQVQVVAGNSSSTGLTTAEKVGGAVVAAGAVVALCYLFCDQASDSPDGIQVLETSDGTKYEGQVQNGVPNGFGAITWPDGVRYEGDWIDGKRTGHGIATWADGDRYEGDWIDGYRTGRGVFTWANGNRYNGDFIEGVLTGRGVFTWADGDRYEGDFINDKATGQGVFTWPFGVKHEGEFIEAGANGRGVLTMANGDSCDGDWRGGILTGQGSGVRNGVPAPCFPEGHLFTFEQP